MLMLIFYHNLVRRLVLHQLMIVYLDAHLFNVDIIPAEYVDVLYYLKNNTFPLEYTNKQK